MSQPVTSGPMHHGIKKLLLLGGGHAHVHVLSRLAQQRPADLDITVVTPYPYQTYSGMVPGLVAGHYSETDCQIPLEPLIRAAGAKWVRARCSGIDAAGRRARLSPAGKSRSQDEILPPDLPYHLLSIDTGPVIDRQRLEEQIPGAADNALIVRPIEVFASLWPQVLEQAQARGGQVIAIVTEGDTIMCSRADWVIEVPATHPLLTPVLTVIPLQLLAYYVAVDRGADVDQPRNLAKSVTVE